MNEPFVILQFSNYVKPKPQENKSRDWVLNGKNHEFYDYIIDRKNGSPTNGAIIEGKANLIYGKGLSARANKDNTAKRAFLRKILKPSEVRKMVNDYATFTEFSIEVIENRKGEISSITHIPKNKIAPSIENERGEIERYWYSRDWKKYNKPENTPIELPAWNGKKQKRSVYCAKPYQPGKMYFADPAYLSCLQYADLEEELANLFVNSVKNGLSAGLIVNVEGGQTWDDEQRLAFHRKVKEMLTGSSNAGNFIVSFNGEDVKVTVEALPTNENLHKQWEYLVGVARQQILTGHRVTSPMLFGIKDNTGLGNNANELREAAQLYTEWVAKPDQDFITDVLEEILAAYGIFLDLSFIPLQEETPDDPSDIELSSHDVEYNIEAFLSEGEDEPGEGWELIDQSKCESMTLTEESLNTIIQLARVPSDDKNVESSTSEQDTSLFKVRYKYAGQAPGQNSREFCKKVYNSGKVFKAETLNKDQYITPKMGKGGSNTYNPFLYKGGVNCNHFWERVIYLKSNNEQITVNKARQLILQLDPSDRNAARWEQNPPEVAQSASPFNNFWKAN